MIVSWTHHQQVPHVDGSPFDAEDADVKVDVVIAMKVGAIQKSS
jgi:hypothetical protein